MCLSRKNGWSFQTKQKSSHRLYSGTRAVDHPPMNPSNSAWTIQKTLSIRPLASRIHHLTITIRPRQQPSISPALEGSQHSSSWLPQHQEMHRGEKEQNTDLLVKATTAKNTHTHTTGHEKKKKAPTNREEKKRRESSKNNIYIYYIFI